MNDKEFQRIFELRVLTDADAGNLPNTGDWYVHLQKWIKNHHTPPYRMTAVDHNRVEIWREQAEYWRNEYFNSLFKKGSYLNHVYELNQILRERMALLQRHIDEVERTKEIRKVGNTTYITYKKGLELSKWIKDEET